MKKVIIISCICIATVLILNEFGILNSLLMFLLVGAIPGTEYNVPWGVMLLVTLSILWLVIFRFTLLELFVSITNKKSAKLHLERKKRMPKRRFSQI